MKQSKHHKPPVSVPSSGQGASSALEAMIRKRIPPPAPHGYPHTHPKVPPKKQ